jgi:hypothetical protein
MAAYQARRVVLLLAAAELVASSAVAATGFLGRAGHVPPGGV